MKNWISQNYKSLFTYKGVINQMLIFLKYGPKSQKNNLHCQHECDVDCLQIWYENFH